MVVVFVVVVYMVLALFTTTTTVGNTLLLLLLRKSNVQTKAKQTKQRENIDLVCMCRKKKEDDSLCVWQPTHTHCDLSIRYYRIGKHSAHVIGEGCSSKGGLCPPEKTGYPFLALDNIVHGMPVVELLLPRISMYSRE